MSAEAVSATGLGVGEGEAAAVVVVPYPHSALAPCRTVSVKAVAWQSENMEIGT